MNREAITVFAPATVANVCCAFDILGFAISEPGDTVTLIKREEPGVIIDKITGDDEKLPKAPQSNTASVVIEAMLRHLNLKTGFSVILNKGLPLASGLGSSAASAAAAAFAANILLGRPFSTEELVSFAMQGELAACGVAHADNVAPALLGGFALIRSYQPLDIIKIPVPDNLYCSLIHPQISIKTAVARSILKKDVPLCEAVKQWGNTAGLIAGLIMSDYGLIGRSLEDHIIEPDRSLIIPGFNDAKKNALQAGALGCGISGSGPTLFAISVGIDTALRVAKEMQTTYNQLEISSNLYVSQISSGGASVTSKQPKNSHLGRGA